MFMGRVGEAISIYDVMIEAKKRAWTDLLVECLHPKTPNIGFEEEEEKGWDLVR